MANPRPWENPRQPVVDPADRARITPMGLVQSVLLLHSRGRSNRQIALTVDVSVTRVRTIIEKQFAQIIPPLREKARKATTLRLTVLLDEAFKVLESSSDPEIKLKAIDRVVRVEERLAKVWGTDAPTRVDATIREVDATDDELEQIIRSEHVKARLRLGHEPAT